MCTTGRGLTHRRHRHRHRRLRRRHRPRRSSTLSGCRRRSSCRLLRPRRRHLARRHLRFRQARRLRLLSPAHRCGSVPEMPRRAYAPTMRLDGKRVVITGASRGIGEALAGKFAQAGATVTLVARNKDALESVAGPLGGTVHPADLSDPAQVAGLIDRVEHEAGPVDVLVNNAGIGVACGFTDAAEDVLRMTTEVNYLAPAELCRQAIRACCVAAAATSSTCRRWPASACIRASSRIRRRRLLSHFTAGLRADYRGLPIDTTLVELGPVPTDMLDAADDYGADGKVVRTLLPDKGLRRSAEGNGGRRTSSGCQKESGTFDIPSGRVRRRCSSRRRAGSPS